MDLYDMDFVAGFTEGGFPFGIFNDGDYIYSEDDSEKPPKRYDDDEIPF